MAAASPALSVEEQVMNLCVFTEFFFKFLFSNQVPMLDEEEIPLADFNEEDTESDDETNNVKIQVYIEKILSF